MSLAGKSPISTKNAPQAIGPYSQAVVSAGMIYTSGQIALDPATGQLVEGEIREQTKRVIQNLEAVLAAVKCDLRHVVKTTVYLKSMSDFVAMNEIYAAHFVREGWDPPARSTVEVARLPKDALVEIEVIALT